ncbi:MAG TPA: hypothetical protein ENJ18_15175 [Nannocystis exedens]|nr:hypothetical protein [Nannocystis exedens]
MKGPWSAAALDAAKLAGIKELELNYAKGWKAEALEFLRQIERLEVLEIIDWTTNDVAAVNDVPSLRRLKVFTYCKTALDFSRWPRLEECALEWRPRAASLFEHRGIKKLFINKWNRGRDLTDFSGMTQLESLRLYSPTRLESLRGVESLSRLRWFELARATRLTSLAGIESLADLEHLELHTCRKIRDVSPVGALRRLREFYLRNCGEIESITPLRGLQELEQFLFDESTNVLDGDLSPLKDLPRLNSVAFMERPHYSLTRKDLPAG